MNYEGLVLIGLSIIVFTLCGINYYLNYNYNVLNVLLKSHDERIKNSFFEVEKLTSELIAVKLHLNITKEFLNNKIERVMDEKNPIRKKRLKTRRSDPFSFDSEIIEEDQSNKDFVGE